MKQTMTYTAYRAVADRHLIKPFACVTKVGAKLVYSGAHRGASGYQV